MNVQEVFNDLRIVRGGLLSIPTDTAEGLNIQDVFGAINWLCAQISERLARFEELCRTQ